MNALIKNIKKEDIISLVIAGRKLLLYLMLLMLLLLLALSLNKTRDGVVVRCVDAAHWCLLFAEFIFSLPSTSITLLSCLLKLASAVLL